MTALEKYIWVVNTLYKAGDRGLTLKELNEKWQDDETVSNGEKLPRQTFDRWKGNILMTLGVIIECNTKGGYRYYISNPESLRKGQLSRWLLDTYATANVLVGNESIKDRIVVDDIPSGHNFLTTIISAMKENHALSITYRNFTHDRSYTFPVYPYCLRIFQKRWYMVGLSVNEERIRIYCLDRMEDVELTEDHFDLPKDFDAKSYFATFFGVVLDDNIPVERIVIRADKYHQHYLRTLPLHSSQKEIFTSENFADFELTLRPTYDFCMELLRSGSMIEVLEPESLRRTMHDKVKEMWNLYK